MKKKEFHPLTDAQIEEFLEKLGCKFKEKRMKKDYKSQETFAYDHSLPRAQYGKYEAGKDLRMSSFIKVMNAYGITPDELLKRIFG